MTQFGELLRPGDRKSGLHPQVDGGAAGGSWLGAGEAPLGLRSRFDVETLTKGLNFTFT